MAVGVVWFSDADLRRLAGDRSYERAVGYLDAVDVFDELPDGVRAVVSGSEPYRVRLSGRGGRLAGDCDCPHGRDGAFCKHCVAVGLVLLAANTDSETVAPARKRGRREPVDLRAALESMDHAKLIDLLIELAAANPDVHRRLSLHAATAGGPDLAQLRRLVDTLRPRGFVDYSRSFNYARKAADVLDALDLVARRDPGGAGPLYRRALQYVIGTSEQADDSAGAIGDTADRAVDGYAAACRAAPPEPIGLARWLIDIQVDGPGWPDIDVADFADALGPAGLAAYWRQLTDLAATTAGADRFDHRAFVVRHLGLSRGPQCMTTSPAAPSHRAKPSFFCHRSAVEVTTRVNIAGSLDPATGASRVGDQTGEGALGQAREAGMAGCVVPGSAHSLF